MTPPRHALPGSPFIYGLTDREQGGAAHCELVAAMFRGGINVVQIREKRRADRLLLEDLRQIVRERPPGRLVVINDRPDLAFLSGADGLHLGADDIAVTDARRVAGEAILIGGSSHSVEQALRVAETAVDYVALGPIYASATKPGRSPVGVEAIRQVKRRIEKPLVVIGGIGLARVAEVVEAGADGVALISALMSPGRVEERSREACLRLPGSGS